IASRFFIGEQDGEQLRIWQEHKFGAREAVKSRAGSSNFSSYAAADAHGGNDCKAALHRTLRDIRSRSLD
ncbi:MAG TPA: hypothetical protein VLT36_05435, partial [Candidatus Dormibacteraeota bacterium]|nr:hypothetical protein [Candidatus Dormibacteraeota bacterium]